MKEKSEQLKLTKSSENNKIKYYAAFSFLLIRPLFKSLLFEYFDHDIERAFKTDKEDLSKIAEYYDITIPRDFLKKRDELDIEECYKKLFKIKILKF